MRWAAKPVNQLACRCNKANSTKGPQETPLKCSSAFLAAKVAALDEYKSQMDMSSERNYLQGFLKGEELFWPVQVTDS